MCMYTHLSKQTQTGAAQMLAAHAAHLEAVQKTPPLARLVGLLRGLKGEGEGEGVGEGPA